MKQSKFLYSAILIQFFVFFIGAFRMFYFSDDFKFLAASKNFDIFSFLSPLRATFYRPLPTEFFYFFLQKLPFPIVTGHIVVFAVFLVGVLFLYKTLFVLTKNNKISFFSSILFLFHFSHVYQLYWFATFQEVAQFTFLICSLYFILNKRFGISIGFFILALFSKEQALLFPLVAFILYFIKYKKIHPLFVIYIILDCIFVGMHVFVNSRMPVLPEYAIHLSPKLFVNNVLWYGLWSLGAPAMMSDYMRSIFSIPFGGFWNYFKQPSFLIYFFGMAIYNAILICSFIYILMNKKYEKRNMIFSFIIGIILFTYFLLPVLPIVHKWMVRLTIPLIFVVIIEGLLLSILWKQNKTKPLVVFLLILYFVWNYFGVIQHTVISIYTFESSITKKALIVFNDIERFKNCSILHIKDPQKMKMSSWDGSKKLALTLSGDSFLSYYFPKRKDLRVEYGYQSNSASKGSCVVRSEELIE